MEVTKGIAKAQSVGLELPQGGGVEWQQSDWRCRPQLREPPEAVGTSQIPQAARLDFTAWPLTATVPPVRQAPPEGV